MCQPTLDSRPATIDQINASGSCYCVAQRPVKRLAALLLLLLLSALVQSTTHTLIKRRRSATVLLSICLSCHARTHTRNGVFTSLLSPRHYCQEQECLMTSPAIGTTVLPLDRHKSCSASASASGKRPNACIHGERTSAACVCVTLAAWQSDVSLLPSKVKVCNNALAAR